MMTDTRLHQHDDCQSEEVAAYLDGELQPQAAAAFEQHLKDCAACAADLREQRRLLCTLDLALGNRENGDLQLPKNFLQIVTAHAQSDLSSLRSESVERRRALRLCLVLGAASFALLGTATVSESILKPLSLLIKHAKTVLGLMGHSLYDAGAGVAVIARAVGGHTIFESQLLAALAFTLLALAVVLLPRLISNYHRTDIGLEEAAPRR
jgi:anti-sigma factor RsiW